MQPANAAEALAETYEARRADFLRYVDTNKLSDEVKRFYWYHTVDIADGIATPGLFDYRSAWEEFGLPESFDGQTLLDVGPATGFFTFEAARRGARVTCTELPALYVVDSFPGQSTEQTIQKMEKMLLPEATERRHSAADLHWLLIEGPFRFCRERLNADIERKAMSIYDVSRKSLDAPDGFDWVLACDVVYHTINPLAALAAVASACRGTLVLVQRMSGSFDDPPAMLYTGGADPNTDDVNWWLPNLSCLDQILRKLGFREVRDLGVQTAIMQTTGFPVERRVLHAIR
jgi:SAM-dependent methyltransferase